MGEISIDELASRLHRTANGRMTAILLKAATGAAADLETYAQANIRSRLTERSRSLVNSVRTEIQPADPDVLVQLLAGGDWQGIKVPYARLQELGGFVLPVKGKYLTIPQKAALTGPGIPKYRSVRDMPFAAFRPVKTGGKVKWLVVDKRNKTVWYALVTDVTIPGRHYLRDALNEVVRTLPTRLSTAAAASTVDA